METTGLFPSAAPASGAARGQTGPSYRILVADDEPTVQELYAAVLTPFGYRVDAAQDGAAAWAALCANDYDLLITDNSMPKVSGVELLEKLRDSCRTLPTIMVSGSLPIENPSLRISAVLLKPVSAEALLENVNAVLRTAGADIRTDTGSSPIEPAEQRAHLG
jgi:DNA-binding response OmpR family regulator